MATSYGIRISPGLQHGPLWALSPRALRLWIFLAMKAQHTMTRYMMPDGQKVSVAKGQWLTSRRRLQRDADYRSPKNLSADLRELIKAGVIAATPILRQRFRNGTSTGSQLEPGWWFQNGTAGAALATLITVNGCNELAQRSGSELESKEIRGRESERRSREDGEWQRAEAQLIAEGR